MNAITTTIEAALLASPVKPDYTRGTYDQLLSISGPLSVAAIIASMKSCLPETFTDFDRKGRGDALNLDLYGYDPEERVAVIQVRMAFRRRAKHFMSVRKDYVLCGFNENGTPFRHPISAQAIRGAINAGAGPVETVRAAQRWMWGVTGKQLEEGRRQGDVLIVPERGEPKGEIFERGTEATLADTHIVVSERLVRVEGKRHLYAVKPVLQHIKGEHADTRAPMSDGKWFTVRVAETAPAWDYSVRLGD